MASSSHFSKRENFFGNLEFFKEILVFFKRSIIATEIELNVLQHPEYIHLPGIICSSPTNS